MITVALLAALAIIVAQVPFLFWQARRAAAGADGELEMTNAAHALAVQLEARGRAVEDRDKTIENLTAERARLEAALDEVTRQRDELVSSIKDPNAAIDAIRSSLRGLQVSADDPAGAAKDR